MSYPISDKRPLRIGHRGAAAYAPHNTLAGFRKAAELGADMVELDVQRSADDQTVVIHDMFVKTPDGLLLPVHAATLEELRRIDLGGGERIPVLREALETCRELNLGVYIELKEGGAARGVIEELAFLDYGDHCVVGSFRPDWVADFTAAASHVAGSILFGAKAIDGPRAVQLARACAAAYVHPCWESDLHPSALLTPEWLGAVRSAGLGVITWHEERPDEIAELKRLGVDGICSDRPELLV